MKQEEESSKAATTKSAMTATGGMAALAKKAPAAMFPDPADPVKAAATAKMVLRPSVAAAVVVTEYTKGVFEEQDIAAIEASLSCDIDDTCVGSIKPSEAMLYGQAKALETIFMKLARRATTMQELKHWEVYLRMALKAQNQCRMTLETLATIKNPPAMFARQANIAQSPQQVNNNGMMPAGAPRAGAGETEKPQNKLLEAQNGERPDFGAPGAAVGADPELATVGGGDGAEVRRG